MLPTFDCCCCLGAASCAAFFFLLSFVRRTLSESGPSRYHKKNKGEDRRQKEVEQAFFFGGDSTFTWFTCRSARSHTSSTGSERFASCTKHIHTRVHTKPQIYFTCFPFPAFFTFVASPPWRSLSAFFCLSQAGRSAVPGIALHRNKRAKQQQRASATLSALQPSPSHFSLDSAPIRASEQHPLALNICCSLDWFTQLIGKVLLTLYQPSAHQGGGEEAVVATRNKKESPSPPHLPKRGVR